MNIKHFVENPVKVLMLFLALTLMGALSYNRLPLNLFPDLQTPRITLVVNTTGLTPEETERRLTTDFERQLASIKGVSDITSYSREDNIVIHVDFHWDADMEFAYLDVKKSVGTLETNENVEGIDVYRFDPNAAALMTLVFTPTDASGKIDRVQLTSLVENSLKPKLETIKGVAYVKANGTSRQEVTVLLDEDVMAQLHLTTDAVIAAIRSYNYSQAGGVIVEGNKEMQLKFISRFHTVDDIAKCIVTTIDKHPILLEDIGQILLAPERDEVRMRQNGLETVGLDIFREPDANAVLTARRVREVVRSLNQRGGFGLRTAIDRSLEVEAAISEVVHSALIGMGLAMIVLWLFLRNVFATILVATSIPISIIATFSLMYFQSLSLNIMTLGGLALGAGMLVDNAIVVTENIFRHRSKGGISPIQAAVVGTREVGLAITAATMTTIVVFVPLVYVHGIAGILFKDQALTVVYSLLISLLVALLLIPMLAARIAPGKAATPGVMNRLYGGFLAASLKARWLLLFVFLGIMWTTYQYGLRIPMRFFPESVNGQITLQLEMPQGTRLEYTDEIVRRVESALVPYRYRDPVLAPYLRAYEEWQTSADIGAFLGEAARLLALRPGAARSEFPATTATVALDRPTTHPLLIELERVLFPPDWEGGIDKLLTYSDKENQEGEFTEGYLFLGGRTFSELNPLAENPWKKYKRNLRNFFEDKILIQSITTTVGVEANSIQTASEKVYGPHTARMEIVINPNVLRDISADDIIRLLRSEASRVPGLRCSFESRNEFLQQILGKNRGDLVVEIHSEKLRELRQAAESARQSLTATPGLANVRSSLVLGEEAYILVPDRDALTRGEFSIENLETQIQAYLKGDRSDEVKLIQGEMRILVKNPRAEREGLDGLLDLEIVSQQQTREKLGNLVELLRERDVLDIMRVNQERTLLVMADLDGGLNYQEAVEQTRLALGAMDWPQGSAWNFSGEEVKRRESFAKLFFAMVVAIVLVYMVIASILESIIHPLTLMLSAPMALAGVVAAFLYADISLNIMGFIGIVMLTGIVVNDAIVLLDRINQIRDSDDAPSTFDAVVAAGKQRLRPIVMTSLTTILALVPLAMGFGNGAELRRPMAVAVIGGLTTSTLLTLWILPALYLCVEDGLFLLKLPGRLLRRRSEKK